VPNLSVQFFFSAIEAAKLFTFFKPKTLQQSSPIACRSPLVVCCGSLIAWITVRNDPRSAFEGDPKVDMINARFAFHGFCAKLAVGPTSES
jgi:hypothetical protein